METISPEEFRRKLKRDDNFSGLKITNDLILSSIDFTPRKRVIEFDQCEFKRLIVKGIENSLSLKIHNCEFENDIFLQDISGDGEVIIIGNRKVWNVNVNNVNIKKLSIEANQQKFSTIEIFNSGFKDLFLLGLKVNDLKIENCNSIGLFKIEDVEADFLHINNIKEIDELKIFKLYAQYSFLLQKCSINNRFNCQHSLSFNVAVLNNIFTCDFLWDTNPITQFQVSNNEIQGRFDLIQKYDSEEAKRDFGVDPKKEIESFTVSSNSFNGDGFLYVSTTEIIQLTFKFHTSSNTNFNSTLSKVHDLRLSGEIANSTYIFKIHDVDEMSLANLYNYGNLFIHNIFHPILFTPVDGNKRNTKFSIQNTHLGKTHFINCDFQQFDEVLIADSQLSEITTSNVRFFKTVKSSNANDFSHLENSKKREVYRQLKIAMLNQGDRINYLNFKAKELDVYYDILRKDKFANRGDKFILWIGKNSNEFGQNWIRPSILMLVLTLIFLILLNLSVAKSLNPVDFNLHFSIIAKHYFTLLNPAHNLNDKGN